MDSKSASLVLICISIGLLLLGSDSIIDAQEIKGLSSSSESFSKGGSGILSRFRENITSVQRQQAQQVSKEDIRSVSTIVQQPATVETFRKVVEESRTEQRSSNPEPAIYGSVEGAPGIDFPAYSSIPNTRFTCEGKQYDPGMYADEETGCQVYHLCYLGRRESFLCGIGTVFNQAIMNCDFWHSVDCSKSSQFYHLNTEFGKASSEPAGQSSFTKQEVSSTFKSRIVPPLSVQRLIGTKTSFNERVTSEAAIRTNFINQAESESSSSFNKVNIQSRPVGVKTSFKSEQISRIGDLVSPGRQIQLSRNQMASESSNQVSKTSMPGASLQNSTLETGTKVQSSSQSQTLDSAAEKAFEATRETLPGVKSNFRDKSNSANEIQSSSNDGGWRPYFKSKATTKKEQREPSAAPTTSAPSRPPTVAQPDKEPVFSSGKEQSGTENVEATEVPKTPKSGLPPNLSGQGETSSMSPNTESESAPSTRPATSQTPEPTTGSPSSATETEARETTLPAASSEPSSGEQAGSGDGTASTATSDDQTSAASSESQQDGKATTKDDPSSSVEYVTPTTTTVSNSGSSSGLEKRSSSRGRVNRV